MTVVLTCLLVWPFVPRVPYDFLNTAVLACEYAIFALSLVLLVGLVGQISLCQAALVGMGSFTSAIATQRVGLHFPWTLLIGLTAGALTASLIGVVALRVRGLYLAVATLIFAYVCDQYLFAQTWLVQSQSGTSIPPESIGQPGTIPSFDLADAHVFYYVALAVACLSLFAVANLRESRLGRAFAAIRGSEVAAASLGINVMRFKLIGFACSGALAGLGGALALTAQRTVAPEQFSLTNSLYFLAIAVVGGLRSIGGAVASALLFALMVGELFFRSPKLADYLDLISSGLLITVLLFFQGGLGALPDRLRAARVRLEPWVQAHTAHLRRRPTREPTPSPVGSAPGKRRRVWINQALSRMARLLGSVVAPLRRPAASAPNSPAGGASEPVDVVVLADRLAPSTEAAVMVLPVPKDDGAPEFRVRDLLVKARADEAVAGTAGPDGRRLPLLMSAENITVRFGGLTAVDQASLQVGAGEIVGLIGPNGAGKTTLFNAVLGLNVPAAGSVRLYDQDVTSWGVHQRAALGVGRTFQVLQLFADLTVFDNLLVATHLQNRTGIWGSLVVTGRARRSERAARARVEAVLRLMQLEDVAERRVDGLPFGVLRLVEVARTLVTGARFVCFDEPASGLDSAETEKLIEWFRVLRQLGVTLLVIEHDVGMVVRLCDYIYVLDQGHLLASGRPEEIQRNPVVIASYLGTPIQEAS